MNHLRWIAVALVCGGCASLLDAPVNPLNMPLAQGVSQIDVIPRRCPEATTRITDRDKIDAITRALEGDLTEQWRRPHGKFPQEEYRLAFHSRKNVRVFLLGRDWFGGDGILRYLSKQERVEISTLLAVDLEAEEE